MSPLRRFVSFAAARLSSRRVFAGSARRLVHHQPVQKNHADDATRSGRFSARSASIVTGVTLSSALVGGFFYFTEEVPDVGLTHKDAATLEEVIAEEGDAEKEAALKAMFEEWMVKYGRRYASEEEKTMRYRQFKRHVKDVEKVNAVGTGRPSFRLNGLADSTDAESHIRRCGSRDEPTPMQELMSMLHCEDMYWRAVKWWHLRRFKGM